MGNIEVRLERLERENRLLKRGTLAGLVIAGGLVICRDSSDQRLLEDSAAVERTLQ